MTDKKTEKREKGRDSWTEKDLSYLMNPQDTAELFGWVGERGVDLGMPTYIQEGNPIVFIYEDALGNQLVVNFHQPKGI